MRPPLWAYLAIFATLCLFFATLQTHRLRATKAEYSAFVAEVQAKGQAAEKAAQETIKRDKQAKETTDAQNLKLRSANAALAASLRQSRATSGILSAAPTGSSRPDLACYDRAFLERSLQRFDAGTSGLVGEGDAYRIDLDGARDWAQGR
jgi:hypothetical protein